MDQIGALRAQRLVGMPLAPGDIRDQDSGVDDQPLDQLLALGRAHVGGHRALALFSPAQ